jgi:hypothetical protein
MVVACPVHAGDGPPGSHILWAVTGLAALAVWPLAASVRGPTVPWSLRHEVSVPMSVLLAALLAWFGLELVTSAGAAGLAERGRGEARVAWPFAVVMSCHPVTLKARYRLLRGNWCSRNWCSQWAKTHATTSSLRFVSLIAVGRCAIAPFMRTRSQPAGGTGRAGSLGAGPARDSDRNFRIRDVRPLPAASAERHRGQAACRGAMRRPRHAAGGGAGNDRC